MRPRGRDSELESQRRFRGSLIRAQLANPRGFCAGVERAIEIVERAIAVHGPPVYVLHEIVHNKRVLRDLGARGARFVENLADIPPGAVTIFSAHGVAEAVEREGKERGLHVIDATCPLVTKVHHQAARYAADSLHLILIGHPGHPEVEGTRGRFSGRVTVLSTIEEVAALVVDDPDKLAYVTQTTLSIDDTREVIDALHGRFPSINGPELKDICYATQNRQNAVRRMIPEIDLLLVLGSRNSSNSRRLREMAEREGISSHLIDGVEDLDPAWLADKTSIGITAGASAPECLVEEIVEQLRNSGVTEVRELEGELETTVFKMPPELDL